MVDGDLVVDEPVLVVEEPSLDAFIALPEVFFGVVVVFGFCVFLCVDFFPDAASEEAARLRIASVTEPEKIVRGWRLKEKPRLGGLLWWVSR
ncbi:MAG: hypothetical protein P8X79_13995 [Reinekea sp.]